MLSTLILAAGLLQTPIPGQPQGGLGNPMWGQPIPPPTAEGLLDTVGNTRKGREDRLFALEQLAAMDGRLPLEVVRSMKRVVRGPWIADYVRCLGRCGPEAIESIQTYLHRKYKPDVRAEAVYALVLLDHTGGEALARRTLRDAAAPPPMRVAALRSLLDRESPFAKVEALRRLMISEGALLLEALKVLREKSDLSDVPYLIDVMAMRTGRASNEAWQLLRRLTGYKIGKDVRAWKYHMIKHRSEGTPFRAPDDDQGGVDEGETVVSYMGIPILSDRVVFVLDSSGSMQMPLVEQYGQTRGTMAVDELIATLPRLSAEAKFEILFFSFGVSAYAGKLIPRTSDNLDSAMSWLKRNRFDGGTNLYAGMERAMDEEEVEEIILLSDGEPSVGEMVDPWRIHGRVARWNRFRNVRIHCISLGAGPTADRFLGRLAHDNDGIARIID